MALLASFLGAWLGVTIGQGISSSTAAAWVMLGSGAVAGITAAWAWLRLVRRSPKLQQTLAVAADGTPLAAVEGEPPEKSP
ncbi:MAG TPA: hypothetical protein VI383_04600 [Gemmatimonadales bacterium]|nr:hypothetical protein [Gemmatimonadales bacterium]